MSLQKEEHAVWGYRSGRSAVTIRHAGVVGLWGVAPYPRAKTIQGNNASFTATINSSIETADNNRPTMIRQSSLTRLGNMINTAVNKRSNNTSEYDM